MAAEQLTFWEAPRRKDFARKVERLLMMYPALKAAVQNDADWLPAMTAHYGDDTPRGSMVSKPTEEWAIRRAQKAMLVKRIEAALDTLNVLERRFVELRYFSPVVRSDVAIYMELGLSERSGQRLKSWTLKKLATALNLI